MRKSLPAIAAALVLAAGCGIKEQYDEDRGRGDAGTDQVDDSPKDIIQMPDRFGNVSTACDGHGHRIFVTTRGEGVPAHIAVIDDPTCNGRAG